MQKKYKPILVLDFDGVLHSYVSGWKGIDNIPDAPVAGAQEFCRNAAKHFRVAVFSSRSEKPEGINAMKNWLKKWDFPVSLLEFPTSKPPAFLSIDDRAICFQGIFPAVQELLNFQTWFTKPQDEAQAGHTRGIKSV